jgi:hypothetical protein
MLFSMSTSTYNELMTVFWSLLFSILLLFPAIKLFSFPGIITVIVTSIMIYIMISSVYGINKVGALPSVTFPGPPHLGLDGVSNENRININ